MNEPSGRRVPCPRCGTDALFAPSNRWRPFCGERCASIDLGAWASESYRVGVNSSADEPLPPAGADEAASGSAH